MHWLETRIPPPIVMLLLGLAALGVARCAPAFAVDVPLQTALAVGVAMLGLVLNLLPKRAFRRAGTTVNPLRPAASTQLVTSGIYRYTRNPMYLGHALILAGWTLHLGNALAMIALPAFVLFVTRFQIQPEERALAQRFPDYASYCRRVRRWL
ncbi:methyltransferase family protein [Stenotrophomonas sp. NPDC101269]|uniref:methyltransferase family protein n=1 Tax=Stenotrophomonas TaxID=40323 RepID=UPI001290F095|nr:isoprenylcysteine carboxylmethyltransferase family protein [Stenotrophomonas nematodicola]